MTKSLKLIDDIILTSRHHQKPILVDVRYPHNQEKKPVIIFIHGFKGFKDWGHFNLIADDLAKKDFVFVKLNLSHNGTTPEHPVDFADLEAFSENNFSIELDDIGTVIDYLSSEDCIIPPSEMNINRLFLIGHSRGGGLALLKASEDSRIKAVATWAAVGDFKRWTRDMLHEWKKKEIHYIYNSRTKQNMPLKYQLVEDLEGHQGRLHIPAAVKSLKPPLLIIHGTDDETVSIQDGKMIHELNSRSTFVSIKGANHVFGGSHPYTDKKLPEHTRQALDETIQFFNHQ